MQAIQNGFLLSYIKYGDYDAVLHCFTKEKGFQSFFVRGIYNKRNKKKAYLIPLNELSFTLAHHHKAGALATVSNIELITCLDYNTDVKANAVVFFLSDFLNQILKNENQNTKIYFELQYFLKELQNKNYGAYLIFLVKILKNSGVLPLVNDAKFLDPETGIFSPEKSHPIFDETTSNLWKNIINADSAYQISIPTKLRSGFLDSILVYYHYHFSNFRIPDSLEIAKQIFE